MWQRRGRNICLLRRASNDLTQANDQIAGLAPGGEIVRSAGDYRAQRENYGHSEQVAANVRRFGLIPFGDEVWAK